MSTLTTFDGLLKEWHTKQKTEELMYPENPLLQMLSKNGSMGFVGDQFVSPLIVGNPQGLGGVFSTAQSNVSNLITNKWVIAPGDYFGVVNIGEKTIQASRTNQGASLENKRAEIRGLIEEMGDALDTYAWGNGGQAIGQIGAISGNDVTLTEPTDIVNFEVGQILQVSTGDGSSTSDTLKTGSEDVSAVNRSTGVFSFTDITDITGTAAVNDYIFRASDFFGDQGIRILTGVQAYIASTDAPPALNGVTAAARATDPQRYAGIRIPANLLGGRTVEDRISFYLALLGSRFKAKTRGLRGFMNGEDFYTLELNMKARSERMATQEETSFGYPTIYVNSAAGRIPITAARHCPKGTMFFLNMSDWGLHYLGPDLTYVQNGDGLEMLRQSASDGYEYRRICYPVLTCNAPKNSGRLPVV